MRERESMDVVRLLRPSNRNFNELMSYMLNPKCSREKERERERERISGCGEVTKTQQQEFQ